MPAAKDFRGYPFSLSRVDRCGRNIGGTAYWKLYAVENTVRVIVNSVLSKQILGPWWSQAVRPAVIADAKTKRARYAAKPKHASPGAHDIYLIGLFDLTEILRANSHLFTPIIPDIDQFIVTLESMRLARNLIGHMNYPNIYDRSAVDMAHQRLPAMLEQLRARNVPIAIP
jgi:hypothetical protein